MPEKYFVFSIDNKGSQNMELTCKHPESGETNATQNFSGFWPLTLSILEFLLNSQTYLTQGVILINLCSLSQIRQPEWHQPLERTGKFKNCTNAPCHSATYISLCQCEIEEKLNASLKSWIGPVICLALLYSWCNWWEIQFNERNLALTSPKLWNIFFFCLNKDKILLTLAANLLDDEDNIPLDCSLLPVKTLLGWSGGSKGK